MAYNFTDSGRYLHQDDGIFLGLDQHNREIGIRTERGLLTCASSRMGKGACLIVPNLRRWQSSLVTIDPKGENASLTAMDRVRMGQTVGILDPYQDVKGDAAALRCSINPLALLDPESRSYRADLEILGNGMVRRFDKEHAQWDNLASAIFAGVADFVMATTDPAEHNIITIRNLLIQPREILEKIAADMVSTETRTGLCREAGTTIQDKFDDVKSIASQAYRRLLDETAWISDPAFFDVLAGPNQFDLSTIKKGTGSLYICLDPDYTTLRGSFFKLFVRLTLRALTKGEPVSPVKPCLFLLDEFYTIGRVEEFLTASAYLSGAGMRLWPFVQNIGQLRELYGEDGMHAFFANADAHIFFGVTDLKTSNYVSETLGVISADEIGVAPVAGMEIPINGTTIGALAGGLSSKTSSRVTGTLVGGAVGAGASILNMFIRAEHQAKIAEYQQKTMKVGKPRLTPDEARQLLGKPNGYKVAPLLMTFAKAGDVLLLASEAFFDAGPRLEAKEKAAQEAIMAAQQKQALEAYKNSPAGRKAAVQKKYRIAGWCYFIISMIVSYNGATFADQLFGTPYFHPYNFIAIASACAVLAGILFGPVSVYITFKNWEKPIK